MEKLHTLNAPDPEPGYTVVVPEDHVGDLAAEAIDDLAHKLTTAHKRSTDQLVTALSKLKAEAVKAKGFRMTVKRDSDGLISEVFCEVVD